MGSLARAISPLARACAGALSVLLLVLAGASLADAGTHEGCGRIPRPGRDGAAVVKVMVASDVSTAPGGGDRLWRVAPTTPWGHDPSWLLALGCSLDGQGRSWLRVALPLRPNGASGWIRGDYVLIGRTPYEIEISVRRAEVRVFRQGALVRRARAVVGAPSTPTPSGLFAVYDPVRQPRPDGFVGPWVIHLTAHSNVLDDYGGGPGRVAIHGRDGSSLRVRLGSAASHGCIRVDDELVSWLATTIPTGSPVVITQ